MSKNLHKDIENWAVLLGGGVSLLVIFNIVLMVVVCLLMSSCGSARKVERMKERQMKAEIGMVEEIPGRAGNDVENFRKYENYLAERFIARSAWTPSIFFLVRG